MTTDPSTTGLSSKDPLPTAPLAADPLAADLAPEAGDLARLHARLAERAQTEELLDVAYRTVDSPIGELLLAATPRGLVRVAFARECFDDVLDALAGRLGPRVLQAPARLDDAATEIEEYFAGRRTHFTLPLDRALSAGFRLTVHEHLEQIGYGRTSTYKELAALVGNPAAVRAVGTACATNPLPVVVPCHRVLRSDGALGGYLGGLPVKAALLELERAA